MSSISVTTPCDTWKKVVTNLKQGRIRVTLTNPTEYFYDVVPTGDPAPSLTMVSGSKILPHVWDFQFRQNVDIYIYAFTFDGRVDVDNDAPYTDVFVQDQHTRAIDTKINIVLDDTITLASVPVVDQYDLTLTVGHGIIIGDNLAFLEQNGVPQIYFGKVLNVVVSVITMDTPVPFAFTPASTTVLKYEDNLSVDGAATTKTPFLINLFELSIDITRLIFHITDDLEMDDGKFGSIDELTRGVVLRKKLINGNFINYWNVKTNGDFAELAYDVGYDDKAKFGTYGFRSRLTYAGQGKHGVTIRLDPGEQLELLIQDDLTELDGFIMMVQGHIVD